jgi:hypothetical protein
VSLDEEFAGGGQSVSASSESVPLVANRDIANGLRADHGPTFGQQVKAVVSEPVFVAVSLGYAAWCVLSCGACCIVVRVVSWCVLYRGACCIVVAPLSDVAPL